MRESSLIGEKIKKTIYFINYKKSYKIVSNSTNNNKKFIYRY